MGLETTAKLDSQSPRKLSMDDLKQNPCFRMLQVNISLYIITIEGKITITTIVTTQSRFIQF